MQTVLKYLGIITQLAALYEKIQSAKGPDPVPFSGIRLRVLGRRKVIRGVIEDEAIRD